MDLKDLNQLDFENMGEWPAPAKAGLVLIASIALGGAVYYFDTKDQLANLERVTARETELRRTFETKQRKAASLEDYRQQLKEMEESFGAMLRQLPNRAEVAALLVDVSQTGLANGLEFELFQPEGEQIKQSYAELPIRIRVNGTYHDFGRFVSGLAALPRIVTIHDIKIAEPASRQPGGRGSMQATVKTYRYLDEERL